jgi:hypothetical protein
MTLNARTLLALAASLLICSCQTCPFGHKVTAKGKVEHVVLIWLKKPGDCRQRESVLSQCRRFASEIGQIGHLSVGFALPSERPVVDDSFDVGLVMRFDSPKDLAAYEKHPVHVKAVEGLLKPLAAKIQVYDIQVP